VLGALACLSLSADRIILLYESHLIMAQRELQRIDLTLKKLMVATQNINSAIEKYISTVPKYPSKDSVYSELYRRYDELSITLRPLSTEFGQMKIAGSIVSLPINIKGQVESLLVLERILEYLENLSYPFVKVLSWELKLSDKKPSIVISGEIITCHFTGL
jgi:hypothetical protein